jgi:hypothetical protein
MRLRGWGLLALALGAVPAGAAERCAWRAGQPAVTFERSAEDLRAWRGEATGAPVFSVAALLAAERKKFDGYAEEMARGLLAPDPPTYGESLFYQQTDVELLSIVGPLLVYRESGGGYAPGTAHPTRYEVLRLLDVGRAGAQPSLLDFFGEKQLVAALKADRWIRKFDNGEGAFKRAGTLAELVDALDEEFAQGKAEEGDCAYDVSFDADGLVQQFYFHHLAGDKVAVRIVVAPGSEWCNRASGTQEIGLLLPIPARLRADLLKAQDGTAGFLARNRGAAKFSQMWEVDVKELAEELRARR